MNMKKTTSCIRTCMCITLAGGFFFASNCFANMNFLFNFSENTNIPQIGLLGNLNGNFNGVLFAGLVNFGGTSGTSHGLQIAGIFNSTSFFPNHYGRSSRLIGAQIALLGNGVNNLIGGQVSLIGNSVESELTGGQIALAGNSAYTLEGFQFSIGWNNVKKNCHGLQVGMVNTTEYLHGLQIGIYNRAYAGSGVQVGIVNEFGRDNDRFILPLVNFRF